MGFMDLFVKSDAPAVTAKPALAAAPPSRPPAPLSPPFAAPLPPTPGPTADTAPARFRDAVDSAFAQAAAPHLSVYLSLEQGFREMVADAATRAALALKGAVTQGHAKDAILIDVQEAAAALDAVQGKAEEARNAALTRDAVALETQMQEARTRAQQLREEAAALDAQVATLSVDAAQARAEIEASFRGICGYIDSKRQELFTIERTLGGKS